MGITNEAYIGDDRLFPGIRITAPRLLFHFSFGYQDVLMSDRNKPTGRSLLCISTCSSALKCFHARTGITCMDTMCVRRPREYLGPVALDAERNPSVRSQVHTAMNTRTLNVQKIFIKITIDLIHLVGAWHSTWFPTILKFSLFFQYFVSTKLQKEMIFV